MISCSVKFPAIITAVMVVTTCSALVAGECDGSQQELSITVSAQGQLYLQVTPYDTVADMWDQHPDFRNADCLNIRIAEGAPWDVVSDVLLPLGVYGNLQTRHSTKYGVLAASLGAKENGDIIFRWIRGGYRGKLGQ